MSTEPSLLVDNVVQLDLYHLHQKKVHNYWDFFKKRFSVKDYVKAINHINRIIGHMKPVANDKPFDIGDTVAIIREEHGWHDGRLTAVITTRYQSTNGIYSYHATSNEGVLYHIEHTRDAYLVK